MRRDNLTRAFLLSGFPGHQITELAAHIHAANYRLLCLIAEFDRREGWFQRGILSCAHWLNWKCGIGLGAARDKVRVARSLESLPNISEAFRSGQVSYSKVRAMTRVATPENESYLLNIAHHGTAAPPPGAGTWSAWCATTARCSASPSASGRTRCTSNAG